MSQLLLLGRASFPATCVLCGRVCILWKDLSPLAICMTDNDLGVLLALEGLAEHEAHESGLTRIRIFDRMIDSELLGALVDV